MAHMVALYVIPLFGLVKSTVFLNPHEILPTNPLIPDIYSHHEVTNKF